uniref:Protogenin n=1 Tax=Equus asinus TaxID=9793 RepID=A0A9L0IEE7_EQUAS
MAPSLRPLVRLRPPGMLLRALLLLLCSVPGVWCFSELFFIREPQDVTVTRKDPVILECQAHGEVPIKVTWLKNGAKVSENKRIQVLSNGSLYISEVEGKRGEHADEGFYQCLAMNKYGAILSQKAHLTLSRSQLQVSVNFIVMEQNHFLFLEASTAEPPLDHHGIRPKFTALTLSLTFC